MVKSLKQIIMKEKLRKISVNILVLEEGREEVNVRERLNNCKRKDR